MQDFATWLAQQSNEIRTDTPQAQRETYQTMQNIIRQLERRQNFSVNFHNVISELRGFIEAIKVSGPNLIKNYNVRLTFIDESGNRDYRSVSPTTIQYFDELFNLSEIDRVKDSTDDILDNILSVKTILVDFVPRREGRRIAPGFFPFINKSDIDLRRFGIFSSLDDSDINDSCLVQAFRASTILTEEELNMLTSFIKTRYVPQTAFKEISNLFKIHINCKIVYEDKTSHVDFGPEFEKTIKLIIINNHYMLNDTTNVSEFYIKRYNEINQDIRFKYHSRRFMLQKFDSKRYAFCKKGLSINKLIKLMKLHKLLVPMNDDQVNDLDWSFKPKQVSFEGTCRKIIVDDKADTLYKRINKVNQTQHFFGYKPEEEEIELRLKEVQEVIDSLPLRNKINVSLYYKFSELMQKIMYEYGCYDAVYELSGNKAKLLRSQCQFPRIRTFNDKPFYSNETLYYIDLNGAYMAAVKSIPTGDYPFTGVNTKIKDLIQKLYDARQRAKEQNNNKLATTLKFIMTSCWGYSIQRPKIIKHKFCKDVNSYIETYAPFVVKYKYNEDGTSGFVDTLNSFAPHFTFPQFAKSVLDEFKRMMDKVKTEVNVLYENVDAILITERDYNKLLQLGYIGTKLGQFKIEHIFTEIAIKSQRKYIGTLLDGQKYYHCVSKDTNYDSFVAEVKELI